MSRRVLMDEDIEDVKKEQEEKKLLEIVSIIFPMLLCLCNTIPSLITDMPIKLHSIVLQLLTVQ